MKLSELFQKKKDIRIGYFGGSITEGAGVSDPSLCYRARMTKWLCERFPDNNVTEIQGAIGGTGSDLGVFRLQRDLLSHRPDFALVEFAVNDEACAPALIGISMEGIVRQLRTYDPKIPILFLLTTTKGKNETYFEKGLTPPSNQVHEQVAAHYHIPVLNVGYLLYEHLKKTGEDVMDYLGDSVHPNEKGYAFYAKHLFSFLEQTDFAIENPRPLFTDCLTHTTLADARAFAKDGWTYHENMHGRYDGYIESNACGAALTVPFTGRAIGIYHTIDSDSGLLTYQIDGGEVQTYNTFDHYALRFDRACYKVLDFQLPDGPHTLTVTVTGEKDERSKGAFIRIGAFLIGN